MPYIDGSKTDWYRGGELLLTRIRYRDAGIDEYYFADGSEVGVGYTNPPFGYGIIHMLGPIWEGASGATDEECIQAAHEEFAARLDAIAPGYLCETYGGFSHSGEPPRPIR
jgi:hypothetical protein